MPQCEALMADKAALEEQLAGQGSSEQELTSQLLLLHQERAALEAALQAARRDAQQVLPPISVMLHKVCADMCGRLDGRSAASASRHRTRASTMLVAQQ